MALPSVWRKSTPGLEAAQADQKGPDARRRPTATREAYSLYVEPVAEGANAADGPFSAACYFCQATSDRSSTGSRRSFQIPVTPFLATTSRGCM